ncbi:MAG: hypothetical protein MUD01_04095 [Chloroflexaceae bacterium]|nr:hypothetical protein [Chloroflexaceae bacterium]
MLIAFRDFIPQRQRKRFLGMVNEYEHLQEVVSRVNQWIEQSQIDVLNVETVLVSSLPEEDTETLTTRMDVPGTTSFSNYHVIRVWYRQESTRGLPYVGQTTRLDGE